MAASVEMKVSKSVRLKGPVITSGVAGVVAGAVQRTVMTRIHNAMNTNDGAAKPLTAKYAKWKSKSIQKNTTFRYMRTWTKAYQKYKTKGRTTKPLWSKPIVNRRLGFGARRPVRDLYLSGEMLSNLTIRSATTTRILLALTARGPRMKALGNAKREEWLGFSPQNEREVVRVAAHEVAQQVGNLTVPHTP